MKNWKVLVLSLRAMANDRKMSINEMAEKLGKSQNTVSGLFSTNNSPSFETLWEIADLIGVKITIEGIDDEIIERAEKSYEKIQERARERAQERNKKLNLMLGLKNDDILTFDDEAENDVVKNRNKTFPAGVETLIDKAENDDISNDNNKKLSKNDK